MIRVLAACLAMTGATAAQAQTQTAPASATDIAGLMAEVRGWREIGDHGWAKSYFGGQQATAGANRIFVTADLHNEPQTDMVNPSAAPVWGVLFEREYDCAAQRTRIVGTLTLRIDAMELDQSDLDWVPLNEIAAEEGQTAFRLACA